MRLAPFLVLCAVGCREPSVPEDLRLPPPGPLQPADAQVDERVEAAIRLIALHHMIGHNGAGDKHPPFVCVAADSLRLTDVPAALLQALHDLSGVRVVHASSCDISASGVFLRADRAAGAGIAVHVGRITIEGRRAIVQSGFLANGLSASSNTLTLERPPGGSWAVTGDHVDEVS